jgi:acyl-CoA reductase-like NAD-dependent aldehyde dehydrogenase
VPSRVPCPSPSTAVGSIIASLSGKYLKPSLMELGGKASALVLADADLDKAALHCAKGAFMNVSALRSASSLLIFFPDGAKLKS